MFLGRSPLKRRRAEFSHASPSATKTPPNAETAIANQTSTSAARAFIFFMLLLSEVRVGSVRPSLIRKAHKGAAGAV